MIRSDNTHLMSLRKLTIKKLSTSVFMWVSVSRGGDTIKIFVSLYIVSPARGPIFLTLRLCGPILTLANYCSVGECVLRV